MYRIRDWLYIGKYRDTINRSLLDHYHINAMLQLAEPVQYAHITTLYLAMDDGKRIALDLIEQGVTFIRQQKAQEKIVLSACGAGISRSTTFAMAALMAEEQRTWPDAYAEVLRNHPEAMPHPELLLSLAEYHHLELDLETVWHELMRIQRQILPED